MSPNAPRAGILHGLLYPLPHADCVGIHSRGVALGLSREIISKSSDDHTLSHLTVCAPADHSDVCPPSSVGVSTDQGASAVPVTCHETYMCHECQSVRLS